MQNLIPYSFETESALLGAIMLNRDALCKTIENLREDAFYKENHKKIYKVICELFEKTQEIDPIIVAEVLRQKNQLDDIGGIEYLDSLVKAMPISANVDYYIKILNDKAILRSLISVGTKITELGYQSADANQALDKAEQLIFEVASKKQQADFIKIGALLKETFEEIEELYTTARKKQRFVTGIPSGFVDLDDITGGFHRGDLIIVGGMPSMGKSAFCLNIAAHVALCENLPVGIFSLEMSSEQVLLRILSTEAMVDGKNIRTGRIDGNDWTRLTEVAEQLEDAAIFIDDSGSLGILELRARARRMKAEYNIALLMIDYLQQIQSTTIADTRAQEVAEISRSLKALAKELNIPIIAISQLSRKPADRHDPRPRLSDLRESGAIEQDADVVIFIYREEIFKRDTDKKGLAEVIIAKHRHGPIGNIYLSFKPQYTKFLTQAEQPIESI